MCTTQQTHLHNVIYTYTAHFTAETRPWLVWVLAVSAVGLIIIASMSCLVVTLVAVQKSRGQKSTSTEVSNLLTQNEYNNVRYNWCLIHKGEGTSFDPSSLLPNSFPLKLIH